MCLAGMVPIFLSWVVSPILSGTFTLLLFLGVRHLIMRRANPFRNAFYLLPALVGGTFWLIVSFIIQTGNKNGTWRDRGCAPSFRYHAAPFRISKMKLM